MITHVSDVVDAESNGHKVRPDRYHTHLRAEVVKATHHAQVDADY